MPPGPDTSRRARGDQLWWVYWSWTIAPGPVPTCLTHASQTDLAGCSPPSERPERTTHTAQHSQLNAVLVVVTCYLVAEQKLDLMLTQSDPKRCYRAGAMRIV